MANIKLSPEELMSQGDMMSTLCTEYEQLFSSVSSILEQTNQNWSENLSHNFAGKIISAQKSFSNLVDMLQFGADAARTSATSFQDVDSALSRTMSGRENSMGGGGNGAFGSGARGGFRENDKKASDANKPILISPDGGFKKALEKFYHGLFDESSGASSKKDYVYTTHGSQTEKKEIIDGVYYQKTYDIREYYGEVESGTNMSNGSLGYKQIGSDITISGRSEGDGEIHFDTAVYDLHGQSTFQPKQGTVYATGSAEVDAISLTLKAGNSETGNGSIHGGLQVGLGGSVEAGVKNGIIKCNASLALGLGINAGIEINVGNSWNTICDIFHTVINNPLI